MGTDQTCMGWSGPTGHFRPPGLGSRVGADTTQPRQKKRGTDCNIPPALIDTLPNRSLTLSVRFPRRSQRSQHEGEENVPAEPAPACAHAWLPGPDEHEERAPGPEAPSREGPEAPDRQLRVAGCRGPRDFARRSGSGGARNSRRSTGAATGSGADSARSSSYKERAERVASGWPPRRSSAARSRETALNV
jgi:hypothetical protein